MSHSAYEKHMLESVTLRMEDKPVKFGLNMTRYCVPHTQSSDYSAHSPEEMVALYAYTKNVCHKTMRQGLGHSVTMGVCHMRSNGSVYRFM